MIRPKKRLAQGSVAKHYDELDAFYREIWGEHVHHGLWHTGAEDSDQATLQLIEYVAARAGLRANERVCDVGCGYGGTARFLAQQYGAQVTGVTISPEQYAYARAKDPHTTNPSYLLQDWLKNTIPAETFDVAVAIESTEHMADLPYAISEAYRVLRSGGRIVICAWLANEGLRSWEVDRLIEPICREGRLYGMGTASDYSALLGQAGFVVDSVDDISQQVWRTWPICLKRIYHKLWSDARYRRYLRHPAQENRIFLATMLRIWAAYRTGSMRYGVFAAHRA